MPPQPVINKDETYITDGVEKCYLNGTLYSCSENYVAHVVVKNEGSEGDIAVLVWNASTSEVITWAPKHFDAGEEKSVELEFTLGNPAVVQLYVFYWDGSQWVQTDAAGNYYIIRRHLPKISLTVYINDEQYREPVTVEYGNPVAVKVEITNDGCPTDATFQILDINTNDVLCSEDLSLERGTLEVQCSLIFYRTTSLLIYVKYSKRVVSRAVFVNVIGEKPTEGIPTYVYVAGAVTAASVGTVLVKEVTK